jgi:hypothetical protein
MMTTKNSTLKMFGMSAVAALLLSTPLLGTAAEPGKPQAGATPSCNTVMVKTKEFGDAPKEQIEGICKNNRNSPAYWSCMNTRIDKGQGFADAGVRCNKTTASR